MQIKSHLLISPHPRLGVRMSGVRGTDVVPMQQVFDQFVAGVSLPVDFYVQTMQDLKARFEAGGFKVTSRPFPFPDLFGLEEAAGLIEFEVEAK
jgi:hypothetical protein